MLIRVNPWLNGTVPEVINIPGLSFPLAAQHLLCEQKSPFAVMSPSAGVFQFSLVSTGLVWLAGAGLSPVSGGCVAKPGEAPHLRISSH